MRITTLQSKNNTSFGTIIIPKAKVRSKIIRGLDENQLQWWRKKLLEQAYNPVSAIIDESWCGLKAKIFSHYRLDNFKEDYKQIPFLESDEKFLKRIIAKCDEYKAQLNSYKMKI